MTHSMMLASLLLSLASETWAWTYDIYGICNYYNQSISFYEYDGTHLATANANNNPYGGPGEFQSLDAGGGYHHIYQCDHASCFDTDNMRVYATGGDSSPPYSGMLATFWTNDDTSGYNIQACGRGITGNDYSIGWSEQSDDCWNEGNGGHQFDSSQDNYIVTVGVDGKVSFVPGTDAGACPKLPEPTCTNIQKPKGRWVPSGFSSLNHTWKIYEGTTHSYTKTNAEQWGNSVSATVQAGFEAEIFSGSISITGTISNQISQTYSSTFSTTQSSEEDYECGPGEVWQWVFEIQDECGTSTSKRFDVVVTANQAQVPCCLPGFFKDPTNPLGDCVTVPGGTVYNLCQKTLVETEVGSLIV